MNIYGNCGAVLVVSLSFSPLCPLKIVHGTHGKVRIMAGDSVDREDVYPAPTAAPMAEGVDTKYIRGGETSKSSRTGQST